MAVTILKKASKVSKKVVKAKTKVKAKAIAKKANQDMDEMEQLLNEMGELDVEIKALQFKVKNPLSDYKKLEAKFLALVDTKIKAEHTTNVVCDAYEANVGIKASKTTITDKDNMIETLEEISEGLFFELAEVGITNLRKYLTPEQLEECTVTKAEGKRKVSIKAR